MIYHNLQAAVPVNGKRSEAFEIERLVWQGSPLSPFLFVLDLQPCRLRDEEALRGIPFAGTLIAKISAFADDIIIFVFRRLEITAVKKAVTKYEQIAGAKINFDKSEGLLLGAGRGGIPLPWPFRWSDGPIRIVRIWFGLGLQLKRN